MKWRGFFFSFFYYLKFIKFPQLSQYHIIPISYIGEVGHSYKEYVKFSSDSNLVSLGEFLKTITFPYSGTLLCLASQLEVSCMLFDFSVSRWTIYPVSQTECLLLRYWKWIGSR